MKIVEPAQRPPARYVPYDPKWAAVARDLAQAASRRAPWLQIDHVGSTAVPYCGGKGIVDLLAIYPPGRLHQAVETLTDMGFVPQGPDFPHPFPEDRPMLLGTYHVDGEPYTVYVHVLSADSPEVRRFRIFRDRLAAQPELMRRYCDVKRRIIAQGVTDSDRYRRAKQAVIEEILGEDLKLSG
ncbi:MAG: GrpB family protein [Phycisphaerae bacterium]